MAHTSKDLDMPRLWIPQPVNAPQEQLDGTPA
jgi:hypothetical protein